MESLHLFALTSFLFVLVLSASATTMSTTDFIRASCNNTMYPSLCYNTLSPHAPSINNNNALLAQNAISISLKKSKAAAAYLTRVKSIPESKELAAELDDCVSNLMDAVDLARDSMQQMKEIIVNNHDASMRPSLKFKVSNIQTWMSAAVTTQVGCIDRFEEVAGGVVKGEVVNRAEVAKKVTSNALALVNKLKNA